VHDASDMATTLCQLGFEVPLRRDAARRPMVEAIGIFSRQLQKGRVGLFYFAGHGVSVSGEHYLIPLDARIGQEQDVPTEAVPVGRVLGGMEDADNQLNIIILDACRDNPFAPQWHSSQRGLAVIQALSYAVNDARSVAAALERLGFTSERLFLLLDAQATRQGIENVLYDRRRTAGTNNRPFVFFAGHGETMALPHGDTEGFLLPHDTNPRNLFTTAISMDTRRRSPPS
jgi:uncharacterized caspase-like protein